ncbi:MAG: ABC transporter permease [Cytophagaceae bacterium]|nr:ABC transporter permease [Gemmatimonadaceae bacterium]
MTARPIAAVEFTAWRAGQRSAIAGLALLSVVCLLAVFGPAMAPGPWVISGDVLVPPSAAHPLGTDDLGRDVRTGILLGARVSLLIGVIAASLASTVGLAIGGIAGMRGGVVDEVLMRIAEVFQAMPRLFLILVVVTVYGSGLWLVAILVGATYWPSSARLVRSQVMMVRTADFVTAARALGCGSARVLLRHVLPSAVGPLAVHAAFQAGGAILVEAGRSFLGVGDSSMVSWGGMLSEAHHFMRDAWWIGVFPGLAITLTVLAWSLLADGLTPRRS